jgi:molecular chaperone GrpE
MATEETRTEEFSAAAPPDPDASGAGETSFADADAPPASERAESAGADSAKSAGADSGGESAGADSPGAEAQKYLALAQRTQADFENYRKRMARENAAAQDRGVAKVARELLPALDHLEHALKAAATHPTSSSDPVGGHEDVVKGFALVSDEIVAALGRAGIEPFSPQGEPFDPNEHEAMAAHAAEGVESGTVIEVYQRGYRLNGQVLRPARVVVAE